MRTLRAERGRTNTAMPVRMAASDVLFSANTSCASLMMIGVDSFSFDLIKDNSQRVDRIKSRNGLKRKINEGIIDCMTPISCLTLSYIYDPVWY